MTLNLVRTIQVLRADPPAPRILPPGGRACVLQLHANAADDYTARARGPRHADRLEHPIHALVDAHRDPHRVVDGQADPSLVRYVATGVGSCSGWTSQLMVFGRVDYFEVALLLGTCFLVNYVTADGETNFAEVCILSPPRARTIRG